MRSTCVWDLPRLSASATTPQLDTSHQPNQAWKVQSSGHQFKCQHTFGMGTPSPLFKPHQMQSPVQEGCSSLWSLHVCWGPGPIPLGHILSGCFHMQKDIWDEVTTGKNVIVFQTTGQINNLSYLLLLPTATGLWEQGTRIPYQAVCEKWPMGDISFRPLVGLLPKAWFIAYYPYKHIFAFCNLFILFQGWVPCHTEFQWYIIHAWRKLDSTDHV